MNNFQETEAEIQQTLAIFGVDLTLQTGSIKGILGFQTIKLQDEHYYRTVATQQDFVMQLSTKDCITHNLKEDVQFQVQDEAYKYIFTVTIGPIPNMDGWSSMACNVTSREVL